MAQVPDNKTEETAAPSAEKTAKPEKEKPPPPTEKKVESKEGEGTMFTIVLK